MFKSLEPPEARDCKTKNPPIQTFSVCENDRCAFCLQIADSLSLLIPLGRDDVLWVIGFVKHASNGLLFPLP